MSNMSYCRFENTLADLRDCSNHIEDDSDELSLEEDTARLEMILLCRKIVSMGEHLLD